jgi:predicted dithiol-disulfide oxidoreductase (DUF899 family)
LIVYRAFFEPVMHGWPDHACVGCAMVADQVSNLAHLHARDITLVYVSQAPQANIARTKAKMGLEHIPAVSTQISRSANGTTTTPSYVTPLGGSTRRAVPISRP